MKSLALGLGAASLALSLGQAADSEQMLKDAASNAISEYQRSNDPEAISRLIPELRATFGRASNDAGAGGPLLRACSDLLNALYETVDLDFNPDKKPSINSEVPGGRYPAGTAPESIKDPAVRAEYQKVLTMDRSYAEYYRKQDAVFRVIDAFAQLLQQNYKEVTVGQLRSSLEGSGMRSSYGNDFLKRMEKQAPKPDT